MNTDTPAEASIPRRYLIALWLAAGSFALVFSFYHLSTAMVDGVFLPADHDSFYHARRILDAIDEPLRMYQFDPRMHVPEGSWVAWPWAYDMAMAVLARTVSAVTGVAPFMVLIFIAPAWVFVNAALFLGIASRLKLSLSSRVLAMLFFTILPLTQDLHRVGMIDHHYIEFTFVLATVFFGLGWFARMEDRGRAVMLGVVLGAAPAFQSGLFILQLPVLLTIAWLWVLKRPPDPRAALAFALALIGTTIVSLLPSEPFRHGDVSFYLHSWFHLYAACCTGLFIALAGRIRFSLPAAVLACALTLGLGALIVPQLELGRDFLFTRIPYHERIGELGSIPREIVHGRLWPMTVSYTPLVWLLPMALGALAWRLRRDASAASIYFVVQSFFGTFLLLQTFRLHYFGTFALILPLCRILDDARERSGGWLRSRLRVFAAYALVVALLLPSLFGLLRQGPIGADYNYMMTRPVYPFLERACREAPGTVLAEHGDGHYIRFHTDCSVIANNFILTPQQVAKIHLSEQLFEAPLDVVLERAPYVRYIFVRRRDNVLDNDVRCKLECPENAGLRRELLGGDPSSFKRLRLLADMRYQRGKESEPFARLFEVRSEPGS